MTDADLVAVMDDYLVQCPQIASLGCEQWLRMQVSKRLVWRLAYGSISRLGVRVLDVGGGVSTLTPFLSEQFDYSLVDILAHDAEPISRELSQKFGFELFTTDWYALSGMHADVIISVDLFPNVDQRLAEFLRWAEPCARQIILVLTFYPDNRHYFTRRIDGDEIFTFRTWNGADLERCLTAEFGDHGQGDAIKAALEEDSLFLNGRRCVLFEATQMTV